MYKYLILFIIPTLVLCIENVDECRRIKAPLPISTYNTKCDNNPCEITNGDIVGSTVEFRVVNRTNTLRYKVDAYLGTFKIPIDFVPSDKRNACDWLKQGECPALEDDIIIHEAELPVDAPYDGMTISMEAYIVDEFGLPIFCYRTTVTVNPGEGSTANPPPSVAFEV